MAQIVQLKRSALSGKVPDTGSLNLGELALNTYDGKIFFRRSGSTDTVQEVITTNTTNTGSITLIGNQTITGSLQVSGSTTINSPLIISGSTAAAGILFSNASWNITNAAGTANIKANQNTFFDFNTSNGAPFRFYVSNVLGMHINGTGASVILQSTGSIVDNGSKLQILASGSQNALYVSGSSQFTGSIIQSGSLTSIGPSTFIGNITQTGSLSVSGDITVLGAVNARQFNIGIISSSIMYTSGSNKFGDTSDDTHQFTGSVKVTGSFYVNGSQVGIAPGPNTYDFNLDPNAAGTVNYITDSTSNTLALAQTGSFDVKISNITRLSVSSSAMWVTTGSITSNYMHLAKYINTAGDLDFNI